MESGLRGDEESRLFVKSEQGDMEVELEGMLWMAVFSFLYFFFYLFHISFFGPERMK